MSGNSGPLRRLAEELAEAGFDLSGPDGDFLVEEIDHARRPPMHERRVSSSGTILDPTTDPATWEAGTALDITRTSTRDQPLDAARRFADGLSSWLLRRAGGAPTEWLLFDRPAGSERDLGVIARTMGATIIQRHPAGAVRVVGDFGVLRWNGYTWHHEPVLERWVDVVRARTDPEDIPLLRALLDFAVHDLGANGIGALLVHRGAGSAGAAVEHRLPDPPPLRIDQPTHLAPLRHALAQIDGAAVFDHTGVLRQLGVRLTTSDDAVRSVDGYKGTRHTSGLRHTYDDPATTVIAVSEDGPVSVFRHGTILGRSDVRNR